MDNENSYEELSQKVLLGDASDQEVQSLDD